jgi:hypothetical protein
MPDTSQVLLWDEPAGEYRLAKVGDTLEGWKVLEISPRDRRVTVGQDDVRDDLVLTRLPRPNAMMTYGSKGIPVVAATPAGPPAALPAPIPPTATVAPGPTPPAGTDMLVAPDAAAPGRPIDPYAPVAVVAAPAAAVAAAPVAAPAGAMVPAASATAVPIAPATLAAPDEPAEAAAPLDPYAPQAAPAVAVRQPAFAPGSGESETVVERHALRRVELDRELNDFDRLMSNVSVSPAQGGGFVVARLEPGSWPAKLGLHQGDVVRSIAGEQVSTIDDAARVYARLRSVSTFIVEVQRGQRRFLLHYDIR